TARAYVQKPAGERKSAGCTLRETALHCTHEQDDSLLRDRRQPNWRPGPVRASQGAFGLLAAGGCAHYPAARQAGGSPRASGVGVDRHQQPIWRLGVLRQAGRRWRTTDRRMHAASRFWRPRAGHWTAAGWAQSAALTVGWRRGASGG